MGVGAMAETPVEKEAERPSFLFVVYGRRLRV
jgi:hypothetical protein